ncbi:UvrABC system protein A, partial [Haemophilus influenzae]
GINVGA